MSHATTSPLLFRCDTSPKLTKLIQFTHQSLCPHHQFEERHNIENECIGECDMNIERKLTSLIRELVLIIHIFFYIDYPYYYYVYTNLYL